MPKQWNVSPQLVPGKWYQREDLLYWQRRLFQALSAQQECTGSFAEITPMTRLSTDVAVTVRIAGAEADVQTEADAETVGMVLQLLESC